MSVVLLVITDGRRDCITQTIPSALANLHGPISRQVIYDDSGNPYHRDWLAETFPDFEQINGGPRQGFGGAIQAAWRFLAPTDETYCLHLEDDFTFNRPVDLTDMALVLDHHPDLVQLALRRQPWGPEEEAAGGFIAMHREDFTEREWRGHRWLSHRRFFTTNPSLYRTDLIRQEPWPDGDRSEGIFTHRLLTDPRVTFGYWGGFDSGEAVHHIGRERVGSGY